MNKKKLIFILTLILATCVSACGHMDTTEKAPPEPSLLKDAYEWIQKENIYGCKITSAIAYRQYE